jgi:hypothetical protein
MPYGDAGGEGLQLTTSMRLAHMALRLGHIDVCIQAPGQATFSSPLFSSGQATDAGLGIDAGLWPDAQADAPDESAGDASGPDASLFDAGDAESQDASEGDASVEDDSGTQPNVGTGLAPLSMSRYQKLTSAGTFVFAIVPAGAESCDEALVTQQVTLDTGKKNTVVLAPALAPPVDGGGSDAASSDGGAGAALRLLVFTDEPTSTTDAPRTRFISLPNPDVGSAISRGLSVGALDSKASLWPLASMVDPDSVSSPSSTPPLIDALGYNAGRSQEGPLALRIGVPGTDSSWTSAASDLGLSTGSVHTGFLVGGSLVRFHVVWCDDNSEAAFLTRCGILGH